MSDCIQCSDFERSNQHRLRSVSFSITYESESINERFSLPRRYTCVHNNGNMSLSVGRNYDRKMLSSPDDQTGIIGKWIKKSQQYEIHLKVLVSTNDYPDVISRNKTICKDLGIVLEGIAFAETALLEKYPDLGNSRVLVHFCSIDEDYDRVENWHRLKYYVESNSKSNRVHHKKKKHNQRRPPLMCPSCQK